MSLPDLGLEWVKVKVDTGARSSALHAADLEQFEDDGDTFVRFEAHPWQRSESNGLVVVARVVDMRAVRSSSGDSEERPVIRSRVRLGDVDFEIELTLTSRQQMGFRMLLGREAVRGRFLVNAGRSYLEGRPPPEIIRSNRARS